MIVLFVAICLTVHMLMNCRYLLAKECFNIHCLSVQTFPITTGQESIHYHVMLPRISTCITMKSARITIVWTQCTIVWIWNTPAGHKWNISAALCLIILSTTCTTPCVMWDAVRNLRLLDYKTNNQKYCNCICYAVTFAYMIPGDSGIGAYSRDFCGYVLCRKFSLGTSWNNYNYRHRYI